MLLKHAAAIISSTSTRVKSSNSSSSPSTHSSNSTGRNTPVNESSSSGVASSYQLLQNNTGAAADMGGTYSSSSSHHGQFELLQPSQYHSMIHRPYAVPILTLLYMIATLTIIMTTLLTPTILQGQIFQLWVNNCHLLWTILALISSSRIEVQSLQPFNRLFRTPHPMITTLRHPI